MSDDWWETTAAPTEEVYPAPRQPNLPSRLESDEYEQFRMPERLSDSWVRSQMTKAQWEKAPRAGGVRMNPAMVVAMMDDAKKGLSKRSIMARAGLPNGTWARWERMASDREAHPFFALWHLCMIHAISSVEEDLLDSVKMAAISDWKAAKWLLEQINKEEYAPAAAGSNITQVNVDASTKSTNVNSVNYVSEEKALEVGKLLMSLGVIPSEDNAIDAIVEEEAEIVEDDSTDA